MNFEQIEKMVTGEKRKEYGPVKESFERIATMWGAILNTNVTPEQVALCMLAMKISRESANHKEDNLVDIVGYVLCLEQLQASPIPHPMQNMTPEELAALHGATPLGGRMLHGIPE